MLKAILLFFACFGTLYALYQTLGYWEAYQIGYGVVVSMALSISLTFFWLYFMRATPLSLGMAIGWAGAFGVMGFWWLYSELGQPDAMVKNPVLFGFIALYVVGGALHFLVLVDVVRLRWWLLAFPAVFMTLLSLF